ncbi:latent-transforming growth factor beta-binding protein 2 [Antechinus flavipes]|uniref:latent-transforming growth factor beta-binding protein 2 n=1 Tax=Antechinus flavipes TaxID=38775 RepID=UPI002235F7AF|nr:latent-transforming growth factor beta-binding protein 2 [Antechinus flavipes]
MGSYWRSFLPLTLALFVGVGDAQRDLVGRYEPSVRDRGRLRRPGVNHPGATVGKVYSLFREQGGLGPGQPHGDGPQPVWGHLRNPTDGEIRRPLRTQQTRRVLPPVQMSAITLRQQNPPLARTASALQRPRTGQRVRAAPPPPPSSRGRLMGRNVCGGRCCPGWTTANSTNQCIKPVCEPPCQNKGSCSRPQQCICRSGFRGNRCEEVIPEEEYHPQPSWPVPRSPVGLPSLSRSSGLRENPASVVQSPVLQKLPTGNANQISHPISPQQQLRSSPTIRRYPGVVTGQLTSNALTGGNGHEQSDSAHRAIHVAPGSSPWGLNLTEKIRKIKIVFTPTICKQTCSNGRCTNDCSKGDTTTLYSQGGHGHDPKSGFRIYFCQIPCLNGGRCIGRDECWCPANSTGKFCHLPALQVDRKPERPPHVAPAEGSLKQSVYMLPLSNQLASVNPSLVKVHINHPPEATVQIHQVARVRGETEPHEENSVETRPAPRLPVRPGHEQWDINTITSQTREPPQPPPPSFPKPEGLLGWCYQNSVNDQCANPLRELTKQEDCCGSVGAFWGVNACSPCPPRPASPVIENGQVECPQGYKRLNHTHCQDINECLLLGLCKDAECVNTRGSYLCTCKPGNMLDPSRSHCVSDKAVSMEQGLCFRSAGTGTCTLPLAQRITKQICCCSRVGKGWGKKCEKCPLPGSESFREICPAGHGYTYSSSDIRLSMRKAEEEELARSLEKPGERNNRTLTWPAGRQPLREVTASQSEAVATSAKGDSDGGQITATVDSVPAGSLTPAIETPSPPLLGQVTPDPQEEEKDTSLLSVASTLNKDIDRCASLAEDICGPGTCVNLPGKYSCVCNPGYQLHPSLAYCTDENECLRDPCKGKGRCINRVGSYSCFCYPGYVLITSGATQECRDVDECERPGVCIGGQCTNTDGSYHCECGQGYIMIRKGHCEDIDECRHPSTCPEGSCVNSPGSYTCLACEEGYRSQSGRCIDEDECLAPGICLHGRCINLEGSFRCSCELGFQATEDGKGCNDKDECASPGVCLSGICSNTIGSFSCNACDRGYQPDALGHTCEDVNECEDPQVNCIGGECKNTLGSYQCRCPLGFQLINGTMCDDLDECAGEEECAPHGECLNTHGSFFCLCAPGFSNEPGGTSCQDVDECADIARCLGGQCLNTEGSFICVCEGGFRPSPENGECIDVDECKDFGDTVCGTWRCENSPGSYRCIMGCQPGFHMTPTEDCIDIDECANETLCGNHGFCDNTDGSFRCLCDRGYEVSPSGWDCVDVNECELMVAVCGAALCENVEGSFLCLCANDHEEYDAQDGRCRQRTVGGQESIKELTGENFPGPERKFCYSGPSNQSPCTSILGRNTTREECCCTQGASWGDSCDPCPFPGTVEFSEICPSGKGYIPVEDTWMFGQTTYTDADECLMFGSELCHNGQCLNTVPGYICLCNPGYRYDASHMECEDHNECQDTACENGECVNTDGSFHCFCSPPLVLDPSQRHCVNSTGSMDLPDHDIHMDICWKKVTNYVCSQPFRGRRTTYTECCCQDGEAWSQQCALCPPRNSEVFAQLCNVARIEAEREAGLHPRPGYEYGPGPDDLHYGLYGPEGAPFYNYLGPEEGASEPPFLHPGSGPVPNLPAPEPPLQPSEVQPHFLGNRPGNYDSFEGLRAEECGILNGCENGRCVRVDEGYTCDCFEGFQLNIAQMACVDINECENTHGPTAPCAHGHCENTEGSYYCQCPMGYVAMAGPPRCIPKE